MRVGGDTVGQLDGVVDGRVDSQRHAGRQAVVDDRGDLRTVARYQRLALDHRGDDQQLVGRHAKRLGGRDLAGGEVFAKGGQLLVHQPAHLRARVHVVGRGEQEAFQVGGAGGGAVGGGAEQRRAPGGPAVVALQPVGCGASVCTRLESCERASRITAAATASRASIAASRASSERGPCGVRRRARSWRSRSRSSALRCDRGRDRCPRDKEREP